jgi:O-antigen/teichoic acid export membrane protein
VRISRRKEAPKKASANTPSGGTTSRAGWTAADQAASSLTNFLLAITAFALFSLDSFGAFTIAYTTFALSLEVVRALVGQPLAVSYSARPGMARRNAPAALSAALTVGVVSAIVCAGVALLLDDPTRGALLALAIVLPGLMVQDAWRYVFFAAGVPKRAFVNDLLWGLIAVVIFLAFHTNGRLSLHLLIISWGVGGTLAGLLAWRQERLAVPFAMPGKWLRSTSAMGRRFLGESLIGGSTSQLMLYSLGIIAGLEALGAFNGARTVFGPLNIVFLGLVTFGIPEGVRARAQSPAKLHRLVRFTSWGLSGLVVLAGVCLLLVPDEIPARLLSGSWEQVSTLLLPMCLVLLAEAWRLAAFIGLRSLAAPKSSFRAQVISSPIWLVAGVLGAVVGGALGTAIGLGIAGAIIAAVWWRYYINELRNQAPRELLARSPFL